MYRIRNTVTGEVAYSYEPMTIIYPNQVILFRFYKNEAVHASPIPYDLIVQGYSGDADGMYARLRDLTNPINMDTTMNTDEKVIRHTWDQLLSEGNNTTTSWFTNFGATQLNWVLEKQNTDLTWSVVS